MREIWIAAALLACITNASAEPGRAPAETRRTTTETRPAPVPAAQRVHANAPFLWIYPEPNRSKQAVGYVRAGQSLRLVASPSVDGDAATRSATQRGSTTQHGSAMQHGSATQRASTRGCAGGWRAVEPHGFVCLDDSASLEPTRYSSNMSRLGPRLGPWPFHYALSLGGVSYRRLPTSGERRRAEARFAPVPALPPHWSGYAELAQGELAAPGSTPPFLLENGSVSRAFETRLARRDVPAGSLFAYTSVFEHEGRSWLQNADGTIVPADRARPFRPSHFAGVDLKKNEVTLPFAFTRADVQARALTSSPGCTLARETNANGRLDARVHALASSCASGPAVALSARTPLALSGRVVELDGARWLVARQPESSTNLLVRQDALRVAEKRAKPFSSQESWIAFSIQRGVLVTYEDDEPTFVTLASPGAGGVPRASDGSEWRTTPTGFHRVQFKHRTDDMSPEWGEHRSHYIADVPHVLYFAPPFAIHVAYWHERFGEPMSGGCINVSPRDGERLFGWTSPAVPAEWHAAGASPRTGAGTAIWIDRY